MRSPLRLRRVAALSAARRFGAALDGHRARRELHDLAAENDALVAALERVSDLAARGASAEALAEVARAALEGDDKLIGDGGC